MIWNLKDPCELKIGERWVSGTISFVGPGHVVADVPGFGRYVVSVGNPELRRVSA